MRLLCLLSFILFAAPISFAQVDTFPFPKHVSNSDLKMPKDALRCLNLLPLSLLGGDLYASPDSGVHVLPIPDGFANRKELVVWTSVRRNYLSLQGNLYTGAGQLRPNYDLVVYSDSTHTNTFVVLLKTDCSSDPCNNSFEVYQMIEKERCWLRVTDVVVPWAELTEENVLASRRSMVTSRKGCTPGLLFEVQPQSWDVVASMNCTIRDQLECGELENGELRCRESYLLLRWEESQFTLVPE